MRAEADSRDASPIEIADWEFEWPEIRAEF